MHCFQCNTTTLILTKISKLQNLEDAQVEQMLTTAGYCRLGWPGWPGWTGWPAQNQFFEVGGVGLVRFPDPPYDQLGLLGWAHTALALPLCVCQAQAILLQFIAISAVHCHEIQCKANSNETHSGTPINTTSAHCHGVKDCTLLL